MKTRAAVAFEAKKPLEIVELDLEGPKAGEVLVEIMATGICHTDAYTLDGFDSEGIFPSVLGHEGAGADVAGAAVEVVVEREVVVGAAPGFQVGVGAPDGEAGGEVVDALAHRCELVERGPADGLADGGDEHRPADDLRLSGVGVE